MPLAKSVVKFEGLNKNHSYCSAWLKDKERFCRRTVADSDQRRRRFLLQSISCDREYAGNDTEEIADLYFCKGWHRKGGRYAIPSTERLKVLQMCFPMVPSANEASTTPQPDETDRRTAPPSRPRHVIEHGDSLFSLAPVLMNGNQTASLPSDAPVSLVTNISSRFEGPEVPEAERLTFSIALPALNSMGNGVSTLNNLPASTPTLVKNRAESSPVERPPWEREFQRQAQTEHLSPDHDNESPSIQQLRRSARIRVLEPGSPSAVSRLTEQADHLPLRKPATQIRQRARLREQEIRPPRSANHPSNNREPSSRFAPDRRRSARTQGQGQHANVDASGAQVLATTRTPAPQNSPVGRSNDSDHIQLTQTSLSSSARRPLE